MCAFSCFWSSFMSSRGYFAFSGGSSTWRTGWFVVGGVEAEGSDGSQQKRISYKLLPLQPISGRSLLTYVFPFTLQYVCQRAIAPLTQILLFMPSLFTHFSPAPFIAAHPSFSTSFSSDSYFLICLLFLLLFLLPSPFFPWISAHHLSPLPWRLLSPFPLCPLSYFYFTRAEAKGHPHVQRGVLFRATSVLDFIWSYLRSQEPWTFSSFLTVTEDTARESRGSRYSPSKFKNKKQKNKKQPTKMHTWKQESFWSVFVSV